MKDFFISYNKADRDWAEWIAWTLEEVGYSVVIQAWDFRPGENFALKMQEAAKDTRQTIAVLSEAYLGALFTQPEWAAAFARDPKGAERTLIPVRVRECKPEGILRPTIYVDLVGRSRQDATKLLLDGIGEQRAKPETAPAFPSGTSADSADRLIANPVVYPGGVTQDPSNIPSNLPTGVPFFTGREDVLKRLEVELGSTRATAIAQRQAISGLGGIGKTQAAIEYARRNGGKYKAVLWAVAETRESLISDFVTIAKVLNLPEANAPEQNFIVTAVKHWLERNEGWLLILDNADVPTIVEDFLPQNLPGHLILTSRAQVFDALGILNPVELEEMTPSDARDFLITRTGRHNPNSIEREATEDLAKELDYLPLALEQAGAYIKELRSSFIDYLASYRKRGLELLEKGHSSGVYGKSVRTTWSLNFQQVEQRSRGAADVLRLSAFLNPDRIPAELFTDGAAKFGEELSRSLHNVQTDPLILDELLQPLIQYSLIHRDRESRTFDIHRLVQAVLVEGMSDTTREEWVQRLVNGMALVLPDVDTIDSSQWHRIERLMPHAQACAELIVEWGFRSPEAAHLLNLTGRYLHLRGRLAEAEPLYNTALEIDEECLGPDDSEVARILHNRAWLCVDKGKYFEAEPLLVRSFGIRQQALGSQHRDTVSTQRMLGRVYEEQGRYEEAENLLELVLEVSEKVFGSDDLNTAHSLSVLASVYRIRGKIQAAAGLVKRSLQIREKKLGDDHWQVAEEINQLAIIFAYSGKLTQAESLLLRAMRIYEKSFGSNYPLLATVQSNLGMNYFDQGRYEEAEAVFTRALDIHRQQLGDRHPKIAYPLMGLAFVYSNTGRYGDAEAAVLRALAIRQETLGEEHAETYECVVELAAIYSDLRKYAEGEKLIRRAIPVLRKNFGAEHSKIAKAISVHAALLKGMNRKGEAQRLEAQARKMRHRIAKNTKK